MRFVGTKDVMMKMSLLACAFHVLAGTSSIVIAAETCIPKFNILYCQSPGSLAATYTYAQSLMNPYSGGATEHNLRPIFASGCAFIGDDVRATPVEFREFKIKGGSAKMVRVDFGKAMSHTEDRYAADGEYTGKVTISRRSGWVLQRELNCKPS